MSAMARAGLASFIRSRRLDANQLPQDAGAESGGSVCSATTLALGGPILITGVSIEGSGGPEGAMGI